MSGGYIATLLLFGLLACSKVQLVSVTVTSGEVGSLSTSSLSVRLVGQVEYDTWDASADIRLLSSFSTFLYTKLQLLNKVIKSQ